LLNILFSALRFISLFNSFALRFISINFICFLWIKYSLGFILSAFTVKYSFILVIFKLSLNFTILAHNGSTSVPRFIAFVLVTSSILLAFKVWLIFRVFKIAFIVGYIRNFSFFDLIHQSF